MKYYIYKITIQRKGADYALAENVIGKLRYFVNSNSQKKLVLGSSDDADIYINDARPHHCTLLVENDTFYIKNSHKITRQIETQMEVMKGSSNYSIELDKVLELPIFIKIKDTTIKIVFKDDTQILFEHSPSMKYLSQQYGYLEKISEGSTCYIYRSMQYPSMIFKILKQQYCTGKIWRKFLFAFQKYQSYQVPNTPKLLEYLDKPEINLFGFILDMPPVRTLKDLICSKGKMPATFFIPFWKSLVDSLQVLHNQHKSYGDLCCDNILVQNNGEVYISGFSSVYRSTYLDFVNKKIYLGFTAPEEVESSQNETNCDIFALGSILYYIFTSSIPFEAKNGLEYLHQIRQKVCSVSFSNTFNSTLIAFKPIILQCLEFQPEVRYATVEDFWNSMQLVLEEQKESFQKDEEHSDILETLADNEDHALPDIPMEGEDFQEIDTKSLNQDSSFPNTAYLEGITLPSSHPCSSTRTTDQMLSTNFWYIAYKKILEYQSGVVLSVIMFFMIIIISFYTFVLNPFLKKRESIHLTQKISDENNKKYTKQYEEKRVLLPDIIDSQGLNAQDKEYITTIIEEKEKEYKKQYRLQLITNVLPYARNAFQQSGSEKDKNFLLEILENIIQLSESPSEKYVFYQEKEILNSPMQNMELENCSVEIVANSKDVKCYLFKLENTIDGITHFIPMNFTNEENTDFTGPQRRKQNFLRAQNLVLYGAVQMLHQEYLIAESAFVRAIEIIPDYIDAYFFLCCNRMLGDNTKIRDLLYPFLSLLPKDKQEGYKYSAAEYRQYCEKIAITIIEYYCHDSNVKQKLLSYFREDSEINQKMEKYINCYITLQSYVQNDPKFNRSKANNEQKYYNAHFLKVVAAKDNQDSEDTLQDNDIILGIEKKNIHSIQEFQENFANKTSISCNIIRDFQVKPVNIRFEDWKNKKFDLVSDFPFFYIYDNKYLSFSSSTSLPVSELNPIKDGILSLPEGQYMVVCENSNGQQIRYPFEFIKNNQLGSLNNKKIYLEIPNIPKKLQSEFIFIPSGFTSRDENLIKYYQNRDGFLIGKYEVTIEQWLDYLNALKKDNEDIEDFIPNVDDTPLFYLKDDQIVPRISKKYPVYGVTYFQIQKYLQWRTKILPQELQSRGVRFRLPNEEEWTAVAQSGLGWKFPWGNIAMCQYCNIAPSRDYITALAFSGKYSPSFSSDESLFGVCDMAGNVAEYTENNKHIASKNYYIVKGNAWNDLVLKDMQEVRYYTGKNPEKQCGFRIALGIDPIIESEYKNNTAK